MNTVVSTLRAVRAAVITTATSLSRRRVFTLGAVIVILVAFALSVPLPTAVQLRDWATSVGPWFPLAFLGAHIVATVFPFPRTAFTLAAGLLFGPVLGIPLAVAAATVSALIALLLVRAVGWQLNRLVRHPRIDSLDARLRQRGWPTVISMRLIPAVPFSVLNYAAGASAVRTVPYTLATLVGLLPGTAAVVILGDALTGNVDPLLVLVSACTASVGIAGLGYEVRAHRRHHRDLTRSVQPPALSVPYRACDPPPSPRAGVDGGVGAPGCTVGD
ncbi:TVP38/TMEM64 family protein [Mycolicibacterium pulveris]|uniref:TVP38/TMEM64 family protein n=1 Tax=Mycolicibacterium pulveris TaxID=36813 RepID=UPI0013D11123|nr:TVP38/TMEM64 family protein [Mycolicibacterium pulveris]MCV6982435.1 TVP38/TMEM64 family protein [Mycolicibacterium pulveris]